ncbi:chemotaxis protein CheW [Paragemmobacter straminiformis]|uniref:Chemotaxis protein CheW n=1 Tax=Paragemmobacter straminiformis TaxID=2045119 RepID=A0A842I324_9RHOB|nr:chemotaxis protein CheW [Gemmobacter straminiformis]MBC2834136.1 chemotaxis protein CheW [Gemmobacter straminiformis]
MKLASLRKTEHLTLVTLALGSQTLAVPADVLREILDPLPVTRVPGAGAFVPHVVNVRGSVVPLANLKIALGIPEAGVDDRSRILVLEIPLDGEPALVAIQADAVHEVTTIETLRIERVPETASLWPPEYLIGLYKGAEGFVLLPDLPAIFSAQTSQAAAA